VPDGSASGDEIIAKILATRQKRAAADAARAARATNPAEARDTARSPTRAPPPPTANETTGQGFVRVPLPAESAGTRPAAPARQATDLGDRVVAINAPVAQNDDVAIEAKLAADELERRRKGPGSFKLFGSAGRSLSRRGSG
jgi:hypothetical protein